MTDLLKLAERCEQATGPDRELDYAIADAALGSIKPPFRRGYCERYTASLDAAMTLVPEETRWPWNVTIATAYRSVSVIPNHGDSYGVNDPFCGHSRGKAATVPLAICAAALRARASMEKNDG